MAPCHQLVGRIAGPCKEGFWEPSEKQHILTTFPVHSLTWPLMTLTSSFGRMAESPLFPLLVSWLHMCSNIRSHAVDTGRCVHLSDSERMLYPGVRGNAMSECARRSRVSNPSPGHGTLSRSHPRQDHLRQGERIET